MASTTASSLHAALDRLKELADLPPDWHSYGAIPPSTAAISGARQVLSALAQPLARSGFNVEPWTIGARADGGVMIEWRRSHGALEVHVEPDGTLGYLFENGTSARQIEADDVSIADIRHLFEGSPL